MSTVTKPPVTWVVQTNLGSRSDLERIQLACARLALGLSPGGFPVDVDAAVVAARPLEIDAEWRLFIVAGRSSSASRYRTGGGPEVRPDLPDDVAALALSAVARWSPAPAFVLDIAASNGRLAVIEYNGLNSAGFYACDIEAIVRDMSAMVAEGSLIHEAGKGTVARRRAV